MESRRVIALACALAIVVQLATVTNIDAQPLNNVAVQWNALGSQLVCASTGFKVFGLQPFLTQLHLAQWHALLALKGTGDCSPPEAVVAYASHKVLSYYFQYYQELAIDVLLDAQIRALGLTESQQKLAERLGGAVARDIVKKRDVSRKFSLKSIKDAIDARLQDKTPGLFSYHNDTPAGIANAVFVSSVNSQPYVIYDPVEFIEDHLEDLKPPTVPSDAWDAEYDALKNNGRVDWSGRTVEINRTAALYSCSVSMYCSLETLSFYVARSVLPNDTSLYDTVVVLAKMGVAIYDATMVVTNLQWGFNFWRPFLAFRRGDPRHPPIPTWTPFSDNPYHAEYPSGTTTQVSAGMTILKKFLGHNDKPFSLYRGVVTSEFDCAIPIGTDIGTRSYKNLAEIVNESRFGRMYAGAHWNISTLHGVEAGKRVAKYVDRHWGARTTPSGILPDNTYLNVRAKLPEKAGQFSPLTVEY